MLIKIPAAQGLVLRRLKSVFRFPEQDVPQIPASLSNTEEIERAAEQCRLHWKLDLDGPILEVGRVLERAAVVIVSQLPDAQRVGAFSRCGPLAVIVLNPAVKSTARWHFDIGHECGHLVMHSNAPRNSHQQHRNGSRGRPICKRVFVTTEGIRARISCAGNLLLETYLRRERKRRRDLLSGGVKLVELRCERFCNVVRSISTLKCPGNWMALISCSSSLH